jgi:hypothetical protein
VTDYSEQAPKSLHEMSQVALVVMDNANAVTQELKNAIALRSADQQCCAPIKSLKSSAAS